MFWNKRKYKLLLFDLDHTLWDFETNARDAIYDIFTELKLNEKISDFDLFYKTYEEHNHRLWAEYEAGNLKKEQLRTLRFHLTLKDFGINNSDMANYFGETYLTLSPKKTALFADVKETLDYLQPKYEMAIITNGFPEVQHIKIASCGLDNYFKRLFISEQIGYPKPRPEIFHAAVTAFNMKKKSCLMIGDNWDSDIEGAKNYGIDQVYFNPKKNAVEGKSTYEIATIKELLSFL